MLAAHGLAGPRWQDLTAFARNRNLPEQKRAALRLLFFYRTNHLYLMDCAFPESW